MSPSGFPLPPIIHEKVMNVTLSFVHEEANNRERNDNNEE